MILHAMSMLSPLLFQVFRSSFWLALLLVLWLPQQCTIWVAWTLAWWLILGVHRNENIWNLLSYFATFQHVLCLGKILALAIILRVCGRNVRAFRHVYQIHTLRYFLRGGHVALTCSIVFQYITRERGPWKAVYYDAVDIQYICKPNIL